MHSQLVREHIFFPSSVPFLGRCGLVDCGGMSRGPWSSGTGLEDVVRIVLGGAKAAKRGVQSDHLVRHGITGGVGVKTAIDCKAPG